MTANLDKSTEAKVKALITAVCRQVPGIKAEDLLKQTPRGRGVRHILEKVAVGCFEQSKDEGWLKAARAIRKGLAGFRSKPFRGLAAEDSKSSADAVEAPRFGTK
jgi:hypothetical protein